MARKPDVSAYKSFEQITDRLDEIVGQVRDKNTSLERSLDLFDEAIALGSKAVDMVDTTNFSAEEREKLQGEATAEDSDEKSAPEASPSDNTSKES